MEGLESEEGDAVTEAGTTAKGCRQLVEAGKDKGTGSLLKPPEHSLADALTLAL